MERDYKGKEYNDYKNPTLWAITLVACFVGLFPIFFLNMSLGGIITATIVAIVWVGLWIAYKQTGSFKKRYGYQ